MTLTYKKTRKGYLVRLQRKGTTYQAEEKTFMAIDQYGQTLHGLKHPRNEVAV